MNHWLILPILLPALVAPLLMIVARHDITLARVFSVASSLLLVVIALVLLSMASDGAIRSYELGNWAAPFGIVLVLDRLSALMVVLASVLGLVVLLHAIAGWDNRGRHFHPIYQFQLMGINGAFLTGDFFNLFVFFEVLLIASYGLMVHGGGALRVKAGVQYVTVNLIGSSVFLVAVGLIYNVTGTLNMADLALKVPAVAEADRAILHTGALLLMLVFAVKAALVPMHVWLPATYANAPGPVAALFAIMTKVGAYAIIRFFSLAFGASAGESAWLTEPWLLPMALITLVVGMTGAMSARSLGQLAAYAVVGSMGTLMSAVALFEPAAMSAALYYLVHSTLAGAAMFLIVDLIAERRGVHRDRLDLSPRFAQFGLVGAAFFAAAIAMAGMPPLSGFVGKLLVLDAARDHASVAWIWGVILVTSLMLMIGLSRAGSMIFWKSTEVAVRHQPATGRPAAVMPLVAVGVLLAGLVLITVLAGPLHVWLDETSAQLFEPLRYIEAVLGRGEG